MFEWWKEFYKKGSLDQKNQFLELNTCLSFFILLINHGNQKIENSFIDVGWDIKRLKRQESKRDLRIHFIEDKVP